MGEGSHQGAGGGCRSGLDLPACQFKREPQGASGSPLPAWTNVSSSIPAAPFGGSAVQVVYDASDRYFLAIEPNFPGIERSWVLEAPGWKSVPTPTSMQPREACALVYDAALGAVVLFGGYNQTLLGWLNDTWEYRSGAWTQYLSNASTTPPGRAWAGASYDPTIQKIVMFGGIYVNAIGQTRARNDTWTFSQNGWAAVHTGAAPPGGTIPVSTYDPGSKVVVIFGGDRSDLSPSWETWTFDGTSWRNVSSGPAKSPPASYLAGGVTLTGYGGMIEWGGSSTYSVPTFNSTWTYSAGNWTNLSSVVGHAPPPAFADGIFAADPVDDFALLLVGPGDVWMLGPNIGLILSVTPQSIDVGQNVTIGVRTLSSAAGLTFAYAGLPPGCSTSNTTMLACSPSAAGNYLLRVTATTPSNLSAVGVTWLNVSPRLTISSFAATPNPITLGNATTIEVNVSGGTTPYLFSYPGFPSGCTSNDSPTLVCTPSVFGNLSVQILVADSVGEKATSGFVLQVNQRPTLISFVANPALSEVGLPILFEASVQAGTPPYSFSYSGLPTGCSSMNSPTLACSPTDPGAYNVTVAASDSLGWGVSATTSVQVAPGLRVPNATMTPSETDVGLPISVQITAIGGLSPLHYSASGFPGKCILSTSPSAQCFPDVVGSYHVTLQTSDRLGVTVDVTLNLTVNSPLLAKVGLPNGSVSEVGENTTFDWKAVNGTPPITFAVSASGGAPIPSGCRELLENTTTCYWSKPAVVSLVLTVSDQVGSIATVSQVVTVQPRLSILDFSASPGQPLTAARFVLSVNASGGVEPLSFSYAGLPPGCVNQDTPTLNCSSAQGGTYLVRVSVTDYLRVGENDSLEVVVVPGFLGVSDIDWGFAAGVAIASTFAAIALRNRRRRRATEPPADETRSTESPNEPVEDASESSPE